MCNHIPLSTILDFIVRINIFISSFFPLIISFIFFNSHRLFWLRANKNQISTLLTLCVGKPLVTGGFTCQRANNANLSPYHDVMLLAHQATTPVHYVNTTAGHTYVAQPGTVIAQPAVAGSSQQMAYQTQQWTSVGKGPLSPPSPAPQPQSPPPYTPYPEPTEQGNL